MEEQATDYLPLFNPIVLTLRAGFEIILTMLSSTEPNMSYQEIVPDRHETRMDQIKQPFRDMVQPLEQIVESVKNGSITTEQGYQDASLLFYNALPPDNLVTHLFFEETLEFLYPIALLIRELHREANEGRFENCRFTQGFMLLHISKRLVVNSKNKHDGFYALLDHPRMPLVDSVCLSGDECPRPSSGRMRRAHKFEPTQINLGPNP